MKHLKTALYSEHEKLGAKIVPFAGYLMPVSYSGTLADEYNAVRNKVGIFDVSHMGQIFIEGPESVQFLNYVTTNNIDKIKIGGAQYNMFCSDDGTVIDDIIVYKKSEESFFIIVNASNIDKDYKWLNKNNINNVNIRNLSDQYSILAIQGPLSRKKIMKHLDINLSDMSFYTFSIFKLFGQEIIISRTGYTGELGYEIIADNSTIPKIWKRLVDCDFVPCGLAVRDILRIEMKYCLYGNDLSDEINPIQSGLKWVIDLSKKKFLGKKYIEEEIKNPSRKLICFKMIEKAIPRKNYEVYFNDELIGYVSSGTFSIGLNSGIGLAFIDYKYYKDKNINIKIRNKMYKAERVNPPFIKNNSLHL